jgi:hypothetical protein
MVDTLLSWAITALVIFVVVVGVLDLAQRRRR